MMHPLNDLAKIEVEVDEYGYGNTDNDGLASGILVEVPSKLNYFGFRSFAFEDSFMSEEKLEKLLEHYKQFVGKRVYWTALSERGSVLKDEKKTFAFVKFTDLISYSDDKDNQAYNPHDTAGGSFKI